MNNSEIKALAIENNLITEGMIGSFYMDALFKFARQVADLERREIVELCVNVATKNGGANYTYHDACAEIQEAIWDRAQQ